MKYGKIGQCMGFAIAYPIKIRVWIPSFASEKKMRIQKEDSRQIQIKFCIKIMNLNIKIYIFTSFKMKIIEKEKKKENLKTTTTKCLHKKTVIYIL